MDWNLSDYPGCPCQHFPSMPDAGPILKAYRSARERGLKEGFWPMLIASENNLLSEMLTSNAGRDGAEDYRRTMLTEPLPDGKSLLAERLAKYDSLPLMELLEDISLSPMCEFSAVWDYIRPPKTIPLTLAEIPAAHPWEVFAWLPFGGWNECPDTPELMAVSKYWYEQYGAVPATMTQDVLEFDLPKPVPKDRALALAGEIYAFCPDIVDQGCESITVLAEILRQSTVWYFWWD